MAQIIQPRAADPTAVQLVELRQQIRHIGDGLLTKEFLISCLKKSVECGICSTVTNVSWDRHLDAIKQIKPTRLANAASLWMAGELFGVGPKFNPVTHVSLEAIRRIDDVARAASEVNTYMILEFGLAEIVREDGLNWPIPETILGSQQHQEILPGYPRNWEFDNIYDHTLRYQNRDPDDAWLARSREDGTKIRSGMPDLSKEETFWWFLAMFEIFYGNGFRSFMLSQVQLMTRHLGAKAKLRFLLHTMRNWAIYGSAEAPAIGRRCGDSIIVAASEGQLHAYEDTNPFSTRYIPLFDFQQEGLNMNVKRWADFWKDGWDLQINYQPDFNRSKAAMHPPSVNARYPTGNPYGLPIVTFMENADCYEDITWLTILNKERRDKNLARRCLAGDPRQDPTCRAVIG
ncbi:hypothetical protein J7M28_08130 [bacterium]|nr:hypothetical protein [bacterium]